MCQIPLPNIVATIHVQGDILEKMKSQFMTEFNTLSNFAAIKASLCPRTGYKDTPSKLTKTHPQASSKVGLKFQ